MVFPEAASLRLAISPRGGGGRGQADHIRRMLGGLQDHQICLVKSVRGCMMLFVYDTWICIYIYT